MTARQHHPAGGHPASGGLHWQFGTPLRAPVREVYFPSTQPLFLLTTTATAKGQTTALFHLNNRMSGIQLDRFVTLVMVVFDPKTHEAWVVNAGHMAPIRRKSNGEVDQPGGEQQVAAQVELRVGELQGLERDGGGGDDERAGEAQRHRHEHDLAPVLVRQRQHGCVAGC